jgi:hypothetical protein
MTEYMSVRLSVFGSHCSGTTCVNSISSKNVTVTETVGIYSYFMVLLFTATLLVYVHHVTCHQHKEQRDGLKTGWGEEERHSEGL